MNARTISRLTESFRRGVGQRKSRVNKKAAYLTCRGLVRFLLLSQWKPQTLLPGLRPAAVRTILMSSLTASRSREVEKVPTPSAEKHLGANRRAHTIAVNGWQSTEVISLPRQRNSRLTLSAQKPMGRVPRIGPHGKGRASLRRSLKSGA